MNSEVKQRLGVFGAAVLITLIFLLPTIFKAEIFRDNKYKDYFLKGWISEPLGLGLDLVGGVHLVYEVQTNEAIKSKLQAIGNSLKSELLAEKIAIVRARANENRQLELTLLSDRWTEQVKERLLKEQRQLSFLRSEPDGTRTKLVFEISETQAMRLESESVDQAIETLRNRVDQFGVSEPLIQRVGEKRITLQMPGVQDIESVKKVVGSVAKLEFRLLARPDSQAGTISLKDRQNSSVTVEDEVLMSGDAIQDARMDFDQLNQAEVSLTLTGEGSSTFRRITSANVGRGLSIILDGIVYSSPNIREAISGGRASISGGFTPQEATQLAVVLRSGALPAPLKVLEERTVGPTLGAESIRSGLIAALAGTVCVFIFMLVYYKKSGLVANVSLLLNGMFMTGLLAGFGATLTLPGLAGLALTIGMAVDSNVIIFERIREEIRNGSTRDAAVRAGFDKAWAAIFDSNLTTLLTAFVLLYFGSGPIRGFAVTLSIGIVTTVFCATFVCRLAYDLFELQNKNSKQISI